MFAQDDRRVVTFKFDPKGERLTAYCYIAYPGVDDPPMIECLLDTGSVRIVVPQWCWRGRVPSPDTLRTSPIRGAGGPFGAYEAVFEVAISDESSTGPSDRYSLGPCTVCLARDEEAVETAMKNDPKLSREAANARYRLRRVILGVGGGVFDRGGVCINWPKRSAHLVEVLPTSVTETL